MDWLHKVRKERGLSQHEVSEQVGISQQYYSTIESGKRGQSLPTPTAKRIASVLGFDWTQFYNEPASQDGDVS